MSDSIDITPQQRKTLEAFFARYIPGVEVWAYGSRVKWTARPNSDLDLVVFSKPEQSARVAELKDALAESDLPFRVDLHVWDEVPESFREIIRGEYVGVVKGVESRQGLETPSERIWRGWGIGSEWQTLNLEDIGRIITGKTPSTLKSENFGGEIPFITPSDMDGRRIISETIRSLTEPGANSVKGVRIPQGAILVSCIGSDMGKAAIAGRDCVTNQQINSIIVNAPFCSEFVYYNLSTRKNEIRYQASGGSAQPILNKSGFSKLSILLPPLPEQKVIARILGALDDKIELNRRMNETLEGMAQALFKSWFVDFDPVRAKSEGRQPAAMDQATADIFPDSFQDSELGPIPTGWGVSTIGDICTRIYSGGTPSTQNHGFWDGDIPWLSSGETRNTFITETEKTITRAGVVNSSTKSARAGSTVIASAGQGHTRGQTSFLTFESYVNQSVVVLEANPNVSSDLFLFFDLARRYEEFRQLSDSHSSRGSLTTKLLAGVKCVLSKPEAITAFNEAISPFVTQITANLIQSRTLAALRDALLPKLLRGEISVADAAKEAEDA